MVAAYYPDFAFQIPWAADPNDPQAVAAYAPIEGSVQIRDIDQFPRGRQYELAQSRVFASRVTFRDPSEYLNATNTASPYYPFVQPYRKMLGQAVWPKGSAGNLLNLNNWRVPADGSFESYTVGTTPGFLTAWTTASDIAPTVTTTTPQQGTRDLTYGVATNATGRYGIQWQVPCVPGTQYTTSAYVRQSSASTQVIRISDQVLTSDQFNRTTANGWGDAAAPLAIGGTWQSVSGVAANRSTTPATPYAPGYATSMIEATGTRRIELQPTSTRDVRVRSRHRIDVIATGGSIFKRTVARYTDGNNHYYAELEFTTGQTVILSVFKRVAGVLTQLGSDYPLEGIYYQAGDEFYMDFWVTADLLRVAAWRVGSPVVDLSSASQITTVDSALTGAAQYGVMYELAGSNTNSLPYNARLYSFSAVGSVEGTTTSTTGSYVRLSVTYTATAPLHTASILTAYGTSTAGTVNVDAVMHEAAASAGTFTATGSTIYPVGAPYIERWPRQFEDAGFLGICQAECVDALAALAAINLPSDYDYELMYTRPDYFWPLSGGENSTLYPDATGNNNPPLGLNISKFGIGTLPTGGAAMGIPGGAGATGVTFTPPSSPSGSNLAATVLGTGPLGEAPQQPFVVPASLAGINGVWRMTAACWVRAANNGASQTAFYPSKTVGSSAGQAFIPLYMDVDGGSGTAYQNVGTTGTVHVLTSGDGLSGINLLDGQPHLLIGITVQDTTGDTVVYRYIDDVLDGVNSATTASLGGPLRGQTDSLSVGATDDGARFLAVLNGAMTRLAVWNRELSPVETARLYEAGQGFPNELSSARVERHFQSGGFYGPRRITGGYSEFNYEPGAPVTTMQAPSWTDRIDLLTDTQNTTVAENGTFWAGPDGYATWEARVLRYQRLTPTWVLGEDTAAGEIPYGGGIEFDYDPTFVYGDVTVTRPGGATAVGGLAADIAATNRRYFPRNFGLSADFADDQQAQDCADFTFYAHRAPNLRVEGMTINPVANPALWHFALSVEVGHRVTVKRRAKAANGGAGLTMSADYFVEQVRPHSIDFARGTYMVDLQLSPVGTGPGPTVQPWILEDATLSVLDSTTTLGF